MQKKAVKLEQRNKNGMRQRKYRKMEGMQVMTWNVNGLSTPIKSQRYKVNK